MQVNLNKPYGLVMNHANIRYEQNGKFYDFSGRRFPREEAEDIPAAKPAVAEQPEPGGRDFALDNARDFLTNILAEGPLRRAEIFKVCATNNQDWEKVKTAFAALEGEAISRKNSVYWKLKTG